MRDVICQSCLIEQTNVLKNMGVYVSTFLQFHDKQSKCIGKQLIESVSYRVKKDKLSVRHAHILANFNKNNALKVNTIRSH